LQQQKLSNHKILAPHRKIGGFGKCWRLSEKKADLGNVGAFQKNRRIWKMLAPFRKIDGFGKYWRLTDK
jgi:hypothetical protein